MTDKEKSISSQLKEGIKNALGMEDTTAGNSNPNTVTVQKISKIPTIKVPQTKEQQQAAAAKKQAEQKLNRRLTTIESNQKRRELKEQAFNRQMQSVGRTNREQASMRKNVAANTKTIQELQKQLELQKRYVQMLLKRWEQKNEKRMKGMSDTFRKHLQLEQKRKFEALAKHKIEEKQKEAKKKVTSMPQPTSKPHGGTSFRGKRFSTQSGRTVVHPVKRNNAQPHVVRRTRLNKPPHVTTHVPIRHTPANNSRVVAHPASRHTVMKPVKKRTTHSTPQRSHSPQLIKGGKALRTFKRVFRRK